MRIQLAKTELEDKHFIDVIENIIDKMVSLYEPQKVYIIKIDNWFDHKWLEFSGKVSGEIGVWLKELRVPPFIPDRVLEELNFQKVGDDYQIQKESNLHIYQASEKNALRRIKSISESAIFVWFSGNTRASSQASFMFYQTGNNNETAWYASFLKKQNWQLYKTANISRNEVLGLIE